MNRFRNVALLLLTALFVSACEETAIAPVDAADDFALAVVGPTPLGARPSALTLPGLLHGAIHHVYTDRGAAEAHSLVEDLSRLQDEARAATGAGNDELAASLLRRAHAERLRIVLDVFGTGAAAATLRRARTEERSLHARMERLRGTDSEPVHVSDLLVQVSDLLARAASADDPHATLDHATRAAALLEAAQLALSEAGRIPGLDEAFRAATARVDTNARSGAHAEYHRLSISADQAARAGDRQRAHALMERARAQQIRLVLEVFGAEAGRRMLEQARVASADVLASLRAARRTGQDVTRLERMHATARDMLVRADAAFESGDAGTALDLGSHAVTLLNALRLTLAGN